MHRHFLVVVGQWKFENWHLYRLGTTQNRTGKYTWKVWRRVI